MKLILLALCSINLMACAIPFSRHLQLKTYEHSMETATAAIVQLGVVRGMVEKLVAEAKSPMHLLESLELLIKSQAIDFDTIWPEVLKVYYVMLKKRYPGRAVLGHNVPAEHLGYDEFVKLMLSEKGRNDYTRNFYIFGNLEELGTNEAMEVAKKRG